MGRALALSGPRVLKQPMGMLSGAGRLLAYILWLLLALSGALTSATDPLWRGLNSIIGWLP